MKTILAALTTLVAATAFAGPAGAGEPRIFDAPPIVEVRDGGWGDRGDGRDRGGWQDRRDWRERSERRDDRGDILSERQVVRRLMRQGFVRVDDIDLRRDRYVVRAVRPNGALVRLAVDAYDGDVIARERIGWLTDGRRSGREDPRPVGNGIEFDLGNGTLGFYSR